MLVFVKEVEMSNIYFFDCENSQATTEKNESEGDFGNHLATSHNWKLL